MVSTDPYGMNSTPIPVSITVRVVGLPRTAVVVWSIHLDHNRVAIAEDHEVWRAHPSIAETAVSRAASVASPRTHTILRDLDNDLTNLRNGRKLPEVRALRRQLQPALWA